MITHHTDLLNAIIEKHRLKSYLEIGVQNPANNFDKIKAELKTGVDPNTDGIFKMTSDRFFELVDGNGMQLTKENRRSYSMPTKWDLIFIDGLHHADQVKRDFENSLRCLSDNGFIVIHDCLPLNQEGTRIPRETKVWWGDVYKWAMNIGQYQDIRYVTFNIDNGCMLVWKDKGTDRGPVIYPSSYSAYIQFKKVAMNIIDEVII